MEFIQKATFSRARKMGVRWLRRHAPHKAFEAPWRLQCRRGQPKPPLWRCGYHMIFPTLTCHYYCPTLLYESTTWPVIRNLQRHGWCSVSAILSQRKQRNRVFRAWIGSGFIRPGYKKAGVFVFLALAVHNAFSLCHGHDALVDLKVRCSGIRQ